MASKDERRREIEDAKADIVEEHQDAINDADKATRAVERYRQANKQ